MHAEYMRSASSFLGSVAWRVAAALPGSSSRLQEPELPSSGYEFERGSSARHESASQHGPTVAHLTALLADEILPHQAAEQRLKRLPTEATPPQFTAKDLGQLGAANADALAIKAKAIFSTAELKAKAEAAVKRREAAGISDSVERMQPDDPPPFDQRVRPHPSSHPYLRLTPSAPQLAPLPTLALALALARAISIVIALAARRSPSPSYLHARPQPDNLTRSLSASELRYCGRVL